VSRRLEKTHIEMPIPPEEQVEIFARSSPYRRPLVVFGLLLALTLFLRWLPPIQRHELWQAIIVQRKLMVGLVLFAILSVSLLWARGQELDNSIFLFFNLRGRRPRWLDIAMFILTQVGSGILAVALASFLFFTGQRSLALEIVLGTITMGLLTESVKILISRARPFMLHDNARIIGWREPGHSFPSGHTAQAFFFMTVAINQFGWSHWTAIALYGLATAVGLTRIYVGMHFPRDVIGGAILGISWGLVFTLISPFWHTWFAF
jgi:membrane-associated phospholipid phosphatase